MNWFKRDSLLSVVMLAAVLTICIEGAALRQNYSQSSKAGADLEQKMRERENLQQQLPTLSEENEQAILRELIAAAKQLTEAKAVIGVTGGLESKPLSPKSIDAYFEIANSVEKMRGMAGESHITIRPEERFGFSSHATEGPGKELLPDVLRQCTVTQFLVAALFDSHPVALISVQRERPLTSLQRSGRNQGRSSESAAPGPLQRNEPSDFFELAPAGSLRAAGRLDSEAFRFEFSGQTAVLREFLNHLACAPQSFAVRSVEVEPVSSGSAKTSSPTPASLAVPIIAQTFSRFRVTVELIWPSNESESPAS